MLNRLSELKTRAELNEKEQVALRRQIHAKPELGFEEHETSALLAQSLNSLGFAVKSKVAKTGVVGDLGAGKTIAIRADMDALPIQEETRLSYASTIAGVMHSCGHDAHCAIADGAAKLLSKEKTLPGKIRILFQPCEETMDEFGVSGAPRMIEAGAMDNVAAVIGLHINTTIPAGKVAIQSGAVMAATNPFKITIKGKGGHAAYPDKSIDALVLAAQVILQINTIVSRRISPRKTAVISLGKIESSSQSTNVINDQISILGTMRSFDEQTQLKMRQELEKACAMVRSLDGDYTLEWLGDGFPPLVNHPVITAIMKSVAIELLGANNVVEIEPRTGAEDFAILAKKAPGAFMFLGSGIENEPYEGHTSTFKMDESSMKIGTTILAETALRLMESPEI